MIHNTQPFIWVCLSSRYLVLKFFILSWSRVDGASPVSLAVKSLPVNANAGDVKRRWFDPWVGKIPRGGHGNPLQYSCLETPMDRGAWWAIAPGVAKSQRWLSDFSLSESSSLLPFSIFFYTNFL